MQRIYNLLMFEEKINASVLDFVTNDPIKPIISKLIKKYQEQPSAQFTKVTVIVIT
jgi:hypothetical protein